MMFCLGKLSCPIHELLVMSAGEDSLLRDSIVVVLLHGVCAVENPSPKGEKKLSVEFVYLEM